MLTGWECWAGLDVSHHGPHPVHLQQWQSPNANSSQQKANLHAAVTQQAGQAAVASTGAAGVAASVSVASENPGHLQAFVAPALPAGALGLAATLVTIVLGVLAKRQAPRAVPVLQARESASLDAPVAQHSEVGRQARSTTGTPEPSPEGGAFVPGQRRTRPLTDEELQRRLAALKGQPPASLPVQACAGWGLLEFLLVWGNLGLNGALEGDSTALQGV